MGLGCPLLCRWSVQLLKIALSHFLTYYDIYIEMFSKPAGTASNSGQAVNLMR